MKKYAQVKYGKIIYFYHTDLEIGELSSIFSPKTYWIDVTDKECGLGWEVTHDAECNIVLTAPVVIEPTPPTEEEILAKTQKMLTDAVQSYMDRTAQTRGYDNIHTACTYANSTDEIFRKEGTACVAWRDAVWRKCYTMLDEVLAGTREIPTEEELIAELPTLDW